MCIIWGEGGLVVAGEGYNGLYIYIHVITFFSIDIENRHSIYSSPSIRAPLHWAHRCASPNSAADSAGGSQCAVAAAADLPRRSTRWPRWTGAARLRARGALDPGRGAGPGRHLGGLWGILGMENL